jgi:hypothetical protein
MALQYLAHCQPAGQARATGAVVNREYRPRDPRADPAVQPCQFCGALLRRSADGSWADIWLRAPDPWYCDGRYIASPLARHAPLEPS